MAAGAAAFAYGPAAVEEGGPAAAPAAAPWRRLRRLAALGALGLCLALLLASVAGPRAARGPAPAGRRPEERRVRRASGVPVYLHGRGRGARPGGLLGLTEDVSADPYVKDVVNGEPVYADERTYASEVAEEEEQNWIVRLSQDWDDEQLASFADKYAEHKRVVFIGQPSHSALAIVIVHSTLSWIEGVLSKAPKGFVLYVEEDSGCSSLPTIDDEPDRDPGVQKADFSPDGSQLDPPSWGTDRIDAERGLDKRYAPGIEPVPSVHVYVMDTGIRTTHKDFGGRAIPTLETLGNMVKECDPGDAECAKDRDGHGTHTAGIIAGELYGVAKSVTLHAVKVLDDKGMGQFSYLVAAINWVVAHGERPAVMSASLSGKGTISFVTDAIDQAAQAGVTMVVAAGNDGMSSEPDACSYSPGRAGAAVTVGATDSEDREASYSNRGSCVDIMAPGSSIVSAGVTTDNAQATKSGTSMAAPHVTGAVALLLSAQPELTPQQLVERLKSQASKHVVKVRNPEDGSPDSLLNAKALVGGSPPDAAPTTAPGAGAPCELGWRDVTGPCSVDEECCLLSPNYPQAYGDRQTCAAGVGGAPGPISVDAFSTESWFDRLYVNGKPFWGDRGPSGVVPRADAGLKWHSDFVVQRRGWRLCLPERGPAAEAAAAAAAERSEHPPAEAGVEAGCAARCLMQGTDDTCSAHALRLAVDGANCSDALASVLRRCRGCFGCALDGVGCTAPGGERAPEDVGAAAQTGSCAELGCPPDFDHERPCQCNAECAQHGNCCPDFESACAAGPQPGDAIGASANALGNLHQAAAPHLENAADAATDAAGAAVGMAGQLHQAAAPHLENAAGAASDAAGAALGMAGQLHQAAAPHLENAAGAAFDAAGAAVDVAGQLHQAAAPHLENAADAASGVAGNLPQAASAHVDNAMGAAADMAGDLHQAATPHIENAADAALDAAGTLHEAAQPHLQHAVNTIGGMAQEHAGNAMAAAGEAAKSAAVDAAQNAAEAAGQKAHDTLVDAHQAVMDGSLHEAAKPHLDNAMDAAGNVAGNLHEAAMPHLNNAADATLDAAGNIQDAAGDHLDNAMDAVGDAHAAATHHLNNVKDLAGGLFR